MSESIVHGGGFLIQETDPATVFIPEEFGPDARLMANTADEFLRKEVLPLTERIENHDVELMHTLLQKAGALGLLGAEIPEVYGGLGLDNRTGALLAEKLNWQQSFALSHEAHTVIATFPLLLFGNHTQKSRYLPRLARGEWIGAFCLSEPGSGSDALGAQTRAVLDGDHYVLNGTKMWITNAAFADLFTVFAKVDGEKFTCFLVERGFPGISFGKEEHKLGMRGTSTQRVILENVRVPVENLVGEVGKGHYPAFCALNLGRFKLEAGAVGGLKETLAICARYARERKQFGRPLAEFGLIQAKLGEMAARTFALESAVYRLAGLLDGAFSGIDPTADDAPARYHEAAEEYAIECSIVKVVGSELYSWATDEGIQIHGGYGYTEEFPLARAWRDQRLLRIGEGANEIVRVSIISTLLRRMIQGRLPLADAMKTAAAQDLSGPELLQRAIGVSGRVPRVLHSLGLALLYAATEAIGDDLMEEQEIVAAIADVVAGAFLAESAWIRAERLAAHRIDADLVDLARTAARLSTKLAQAQATRLREATTFRIQSLTRGRRPWSEVNLLMLSANPDDTISLGRQLAAAVLAREGYPW